jgi:hypothetical protein
MIGLQLQVLCKVPLRFRSRGTCLADFLKSPKLCQHRGTQMFCGFQALLSKRMIARGVVANGSRSKRYAYELILRVEVAIQVSALVVVIVLAGLSPSLLRHLENTPRQGAGGLLKSKAATRPRGPT